MAVTEYGVNHPLALKHWSRDLMKEALKKCYALQFMGTGKDTICTIKTETQKDAGDRIRVGIRSQLSGAGIKGDDTVWFSFVVYKNRKHRDAVNKKVMQYFEKKYANAKDQPMPFDMKTIAYGGFKAIVRR